MVGIPTEYRRMAAKELIFEGQSVANAMLTNLAFAGYVPVHVATAVMIREECETLRVAFEAALSKDVNKIRERDAIKDKLVFLLDGVAKHYESMAVANPAVLLNTGFSARKPRRSTSAMPLPAPSSFTAVHGPQAGSVIAKVSRLASAKSYEVHVTEGDPSTEKTWAHKATFIDYSAMIMYGFQSGKQIWLRARGINSAGEGAWSPITSLIPK